MDHSRREELKKEHKGTCGDDASVHHLDCSNGFKTYQMVYFKYLQFIIYQNMVGLIEEIFALLKSLYHVQKGLIQLMENKRSQRKPKWTAPAM